MDAGLEPAQIDGARDRARRDSGDLDRSREVMLSLCNVIVSSFEFLRFDPMPGQFAGNCRSPL